MAGPYYYDPDNGSEANDGLSELTPRKLIPGQTGAIAVTAGTLGNPTILNVKNGTTSALRIYPTGNYFTYRGYGVASNVLTLTLPTVRDPAQLESVRVVRQSGVHEGMWKLESDTEATNMFSFGNRIGVVLEDCFINGPLCTEGVAFGISSTSGSTPTMRRCNVEQSASLGLNGFQLNWTIEFCRVANCQDDGIILNANVTNGYRANSADTFYGIEIYEPGKNEVAAIGDAFQTSAFGTRFESKLSINRLYVYKSSNSKQGMQLNDATGGFLLDTFHFECPNATGTTQIGLSHLKGSVTVRNGYIKNGSPTNPTFRAQNDTGVVMTAGGSLNISNVVADGGDFYGGFFTWGGSTSAATMDGSVTIENCTITGNLIGQTSIAGGISAAPGSYVTIGAGAALTVRNNVLLLTGANPTVLLPTGKANDALYPVQNNAVLDTATFSIGAIDYANLAAFQVATNKATGNISGTQASMLLTDARPTDGSPLIAAGIHVAYGADATGNQRWNPPSLGAYEFVRARPSRLT